MTLDWNCGALAKGLACYERGEFFAAHEHWEEVWLALDEPQKSQLQALIQVTAAFHHLESGNRAGAASLLRKALRRLKTGPSDCAGIDLPPLCKDIATWLNSVENHAQMLPAAPPRFMIRPCSTPLKFGSPAGPSTI